MTKNLSNSYSVINLYKKASTKSEVVTQMLYGESFSIFKRNGRWLKIKIKEDGYKGYIQNKNFSKFYKPSHKISVLKAKIYRSSLSKHLFYDLVLKILKNFYFERNLYNHLL